MTEAEEVAARFASGGAIRWTDNDGVRLMDILSSRARSSGPDERDNTTWRFKDGSIIVTQGDSWRLE